MQITHAGEVMCMRGKLLFVGILLGVISTGCRTNHGTVDKGYVRSDRENYKTLAATSRDAPSGPAYSIAERGPHHRVWLKVERTTNDLGESVSITNRGYIEL